MIKIQKETYSSPMIPAVYWCDCPTSSEASQQECKRPVGVTEVEESSFLQQARELVPA